MGERGARKWVSNKEPCHFDQSVLSEVWDVGRKKRNKVLKKSPPPHTHNPRGRPKPHTPEEKKDRIKDTPRKKPAVSAIQPKRGRSEVLQPIQGKRIRGPGIWADSSAMESFFTKKEEIRLPSGWKSVMHFKDKA